MTLRQQQSLFVVLVADLIREATRLGYELTFGDAYRSPEEAARLASLGHGIVNSFHMKRLAIDFNLFRNGVYLTETASHLPLGEYWESLDPRCSWGGRFMKPDGNHYSYGESAPRETSPEPLSA